MHVMRVGMVETARHDLGEEVAAGLHQLIAHDANRHAVKDEPGRQIASRRYRRPPGTHRGLPVLPPAQTVSPAADANGPRNAPVHTKVGRIRADQRLHVLGDEVTPHDPQGTPTREAVNVEVGVPRRSLTEVRLAPLHVARRGTGKFGIVSTRPTARPCRRSAATGASTAANDEKRFGGRFGQASSKTSLVRSERSGLRARGEVSGSILCL